MTAEDYWQAVTILQAQEALIQMKIADYPNMKKADRQKLHKELHKKAYPKNGDGKKLTTEELYKRVRAAMNG